MLFYYFIIVLVFISCNQDIKKMSKLENLQVETSIIGNYYNFTKYEDENGKQIIDYNEFYISKDTIYSYKEAAGFITPVDYIITNDSLFFGVEKKSNFGGEIGKDEGDNLIFQLDSVTKIVFHTVKDSITLEEYINNKISRKKYINFFFNRLKRSKVD